MRLSFNVKIFIDRILRDLINIIDILEKLFIKSRTWINIYCLYIDVSHLLFVEKYIQIIADFLEF